MSAREDLYTLDGNALVAELALVKSYLVGNLPLSVDREVAAAVLDECAARLSGWWGWPLAVPVEVERLRALIRAVVESAEDRWEGCPCCGEWGPETTYATNVDTGEETEISGTGGHRPECPWPLLVAEAEAEEP